MIQLTSFRFINVLILGRQKEKSDKDNQVNTMWRDLIEHFESGNQNVYFIGSLVLVNDGESRSFEVVDGQQRLITLTLLFVAIKCMLHQLLEEELEATHRKTLKAFISNALDNINIILFNRMLFGVVVQEKKVKIQSSTGFDYDTVLRLALECKDFEEVRHTCTNEEQLKVSERYFDNRDYFISQLQVHFLEKGIFTYANAKAESFNEFIEFLKNKVNLVRILAPRFDIAYQIFEIMNNRGLPLSNKDLFRNFIISRFYKAKIANPEQKWLDLNQGTYEFTPDFINRYVESFRAKKQRYSAFNDLPDIYENNFPTAIGEAKINVFYEDIQQSLAHFTKIEWLTFNKKEINHRVEFLKNSGNNSHLVNLLLALFKNIANEAQQIEFLSELELFVIHTLLSPSKRFQNKQIFSAVALLNENKFSEAIESVTLSKEDKEDLKQLLDSNIRNNDWAKLLIARYFWGKDMEAPEDVVAVNLDYKKATLEHIHLRGKYFCLLHPSFHNNLHLFLRSLN